MNEVEHTKVLRLAADFIEEFGYLSQENYDAIMGGHGGEGDYKRGCRCRQCRDAAATARRRRRDVETGVALDALVKRETA